MQTRAAARRLAVGTATVGSVDATSILRTAAAQAETVDDVLGSKDEIGAVNKTAGGSAKRKHAGKTQSQPLKGGWMLPHGMGAGLTEPPNSVPPGHENTSPTTALSDPLTDVEVPTQNGGSAPSPSVIKQQQTQRQTRQTRLSLRVIKKGAEDITSDQKKQEPNVKVEATEDLLIKQDEGRPSKRVRVAPPMARNLPDTKSLSQAALELADVKTQEKLILNSRRVLIFRGVTIKDGIVTKVSTTVKITTDATQILNPSFRLMIKRGKDNPYGLTPGYSPYPYRRVPTAEACEEVHGILTELHGEVKQPDKMPAASLEKAGCGEVPCVLDALLRTLISGNTLMAMADAAIKNLAEHYGLRTEGTGTGSIDWEKVRLSSHQELVQVIRVAGNGPKKGQHIKQILDMVYQDNVERAKSQASAKIMDDPLSLDYMHTMTKDEALAKFVSYPGIGIKTAACVTLFCLQLPCFAVDTHVHKFCRWLGWVPEKADPDNCFRHGDFMVPDHLKYGLHQLFIRHGQVCFKCRKATKPGTKDWNEAPDCPLEHLLDRSKDEAGKAKPKGMRAKKGKEETGFGTDDSLSELEDSDGEDEGV
ncbi:DNA glycosylase [Parathielavia hyrcaniae]|uniref:DNA glycosylase n=1 Tax=Parathielavia hyrcaniae TaxID=113614 RepID=A0AAN6Q1U8_9PEZI|nr:DNA glycosylase [Parathielavia hyrcaniae]